MTSLEKYGMLVAIGITAIFIGIALGSSFYDGASIPAKVTEKTPISESFMPMINSRLELSTTGEIEIITWPIYGADILVYEKVEAKNLAGIAEKNPTFIVQKGIKYNIEIINNDSKSHVFIVPELGIESKIMNPGEEDIITIYSQKEGIYNYYTKDQPVLPLGEIKIISVDPEMQLEINRINKDLKRFTEPILEKTKEAAEKILASKEILDKNKELITSKLTPRLVIIPEGTSIPGCDKFDSCYVPSNVIIFAGNTVVWKNDDSVIHTVTSGDIIHGSTGFFDSGLLTKDDIYYFTFEKKGDYPYYCLIHPWMIGSVSVK